MKRQFPLPYKEFKAIYSKVPRLCVDLVIQTDEGVLLTLRTKNGYENQWHLPGGTVYFREKVSDTVKRVAKEELGITVKIEKFAGYIEYFSELKEKGFGYTITLVFVCQPLSLEVKLDNDADKYAFFKTLPKNVIQEQKKLLKTIL